MEFSLKHKEKETFPLPFSYFLKKKKTYVCILLSGEHPFFLGSVLLQQKFEETDGPVL